VKIERFRSLNHEPIVIVKQETFDEEDNLIIGHIEPYHPWRSGRGNRLEVKANELFDINNSMFYDLWSSKLGSFLSCNDNETKWICNCQTKGDFFFRRHFRCHFITGVFKCPGCYENEMVCQNSDGDMISSETKGLITSELKQSKVIETVSLAKSVFSFVLDKAEKDCRYDYPNATVIMSKISKTRKSVALYDVDDMIVSIKSIQKYLKIIDDLSVNNHKRFVLHNLSFSNTAINIVEKSIERNQLMKLEEELNQRILEEWFMESLYIDKPSDPIIIPNIPMVVDIWRLIISKLSIEDRLSLSLVCKSFYWLNTCNCCEILQCAKVLEIELENRQYWNIDDYEDLYYEDNYNDYDEEIDWSS